jgi:hypothetical protein
MVKSGQKNLKMQNFQTIRYIDDALVRYSMDKAVGWCTRWMPARAGRRGRYSAWPALLAPGSNERAMRERHAQRITPAWWSVKWPVDAFQELRSSGSFISTTVFSGVHQTRFIFSNYLINRKRGSADAERPVQLSEQ